MPDSRPANAASISCCSRCLAASNNASVSGPGAALSAIGIAALDTKSNTALCLRFAEDAAPLPDVSLVGLNDGLLCNYPDAVPRSRGQGSDRLSAATGTLLLVPWPGAVAPVPLTVDLLALQLTFQTHMAPES